MRQSARLFNPGRRSLVPWGPPGVHLVHSTARRPSSAGFARLPSVVSAYSLVHSGFPAQFG